MTDSNRRWCCLELISRKTNTKDILPSNNRGKNSVKGNRKKIRQNLQKTANFAKNRIAENIANEIAMK